MRRVSRLFFLAVVAGIVASALASGGFARSAAAHPKLIGTVGKNDAYTIVLTTAAGKRVKSLKAGTYTVVIHDDSAIHNYELDGPHGKSWTFTSIPFKGTKTETLKFAAGAYKAYCSAHESVMFQHFSVK